MNMANACSCIHNEAAIRKHTHTCERK